MTLRDWDRFEIEDQLRKWRYADNFLPIEIKRFIRLSAGADRSRMVVILPGDFQPKKVGKGGGKDMNGVYCQSTKRVEVGEQWLAKNLPDELFIHVLAWQSIKEQFGIGR